jgi:hypothetical protein
MNAESLLYVAARPREAVADARQLRQARNSETKQPARHRVTKRASAPRGAPG